MSRRTRSQMENRRRRSPNGEGRTLADVHDGVQVRGPNIHDQVANLEWDDRQRFGKVFAILDELTRDGGPLTDETRQALHRRFKRHTGGLSREGYGLFAAWWRSIEFAAGHEEATCLDP